MSDEYGPEFPDPHGKRAALREAERIMASVKQAKKRKSQAKKAAKKAAVTDDPLSPALRAIVDAEPKQAELFPEAVRAAKHRMGSNGKGAQGGTGGGSG